MNKYQGALKDAKDASVVVGLTAIEGTAIVLSSLARLATAGLSDGLGKLSKGVEVAAKKIPTVTNSDPTTGEILGTKSKSPFLSSLATKTSKLSASGSKALSSLHDKMESRDRKSMEPVTPAPAPHVIPTIQSVRTNE